jgi:hypothetical protein
MTMMVKLDSIFLLTTALSLLVVALPTTLARRQSGLRHVAAGYQQEHHDELDENPFLRHQTREQQNEAMVKHHPMYRSQPFEHDERQLVGAGYYRSSSNSSTDHQQGQQEKQEEISNSLCTEHIVAVRVSEYNVTYQDWANIQYGQTPIYGSNKMNLQIGTWYWEWVNDIYGTMMIYWNQQESIFFGFHNYQEHYPISGGWTKENQCPGGYAKFIQWIGKDIRQYKLHVCNGCPNNPPSTSR